MTAGGGVIDLAREADFQLGKLTLCPSACRVLAGGREQRVQPRVMEVVVMLVRNAGRTVTRDELIDACWAGRIVSDNAVNRILAQVRSLARLVDPPPFTLQTVPKVGVRLVPAQGSSQDGAAPIPIAGDGAARPDPGSRRRAPGVAAIAALLLALAAALGAGLWAARRPADAIASKPLGQNGRVEIVSFRSAPGDPLAQQAVAAMSDDLLRILSRAGVVTGGGSAGDGAVGDAELQVLGSVGLNARNYVVQARIIDRRSGVVLWTDRLMRSRADLTDSPGEPAGTIAAVLNCAIEDRKAAKVPVSTEAFGLYLYACAGVFVSDDQGQRMLAVTRRLVRAAPRYAGAHAMHAIAAARVATSTETREQATALRAEARAAAETALKFDPRTAKAYCALALSEGVLADRMRHNWASEEAYLKKALALDADLAPARNEYGTFLRSTGRLREAIEFMTASSAREDPRYGGDPRPAMLLAASGDLAAAEGELERLERRDRLSQDEARDVIAFWWADPSVALTRLHAPGVRRSPGELACLTTYLKRLDTARKARVRGLPASCETLDPNWRVRMLARQGDVDGAFAAMGGRMPGGPLLLYYPEMSALRNDPRFWRLAKQVGLLGYWQASGRWPDFCAAPGQDCPGGAAAALSAAL